MVWREALVNSFVILLSELGSDSVREGSLFQGLLSKSLDRLIALSLKYLA